MTTTDEEPIEAEVIEETRHLPAVVASEAIMARGEISVDEVVAQRNKVIEVMERVMVEGKHYGKIAGVQKPTLLKPGAEAINVALRLAPDYESDKHFDGDHLTVTSKCILRHIPTGLTIAAGEGLCSTREKKYASRKAMRLCPECSEPQIRRSNYPPKPSDSTYVEDGPNEPGWFCWKKHGGCGANFAFDDERITGQEEGMIPNPDLPDTWNTVLKMADKRALVAAVLNGTAASDVFTQDVEDSSAAVASETAEPQERRQAGPAPFPVPKGWGEIERDIRLADNAEEAWALFSAFVRTASFHLFGKADSAELDQKQKDVLYQKAAGAVVWLHENKVFEMGELFFFDQAKQRTAFQHVLNTKDPLPIPDYVEPEPPGAEDVDEEAERMAREAMAGD